jgi:hypothetical protein
MAETTGITGDKLFINDLAVTDQAVQVEIYDMKGSLLRRIKGYVVNKRLTTDIGGIANGIYFLKAQTKEGLLTQKVFVNR